jgi:hypothetical protein
MAGGPGADTRPGREAREALMCARTELVAATGEQRRRVGPPCPSPAGGQSDPAARFPARGDFLMLSRCSVGEDHKSRTGAVVHAAHHRPRREPVHPLSSRSKKARPMPGKSLTRFASQLPDPPSDPPE